MRSRLGPKEVLSDPIYSADTEIGRQLPYTFLNQLRINIGMSNPRVQELYDLLPEERLSSICRQTAVRCRSLWMTESGNEIVLGK